MIGQSISIGDRIMRCLYISSAPNVKRLPLSPVALGSPLFPIFRPRTTTEMPGLGVSLWRDPL
jgi:hypothetical protein